MGAEQQLLQHLYEVLALDQKPPAKQTPTQLQPNFTPNQKLLQAAVAYVDAYILKAPDTNQTQASSLARQGFQLQLDNGHNVIPDHEKNETMTSSHAQLWHAAAASLLYASLQVQDETVIPLAQSWWRAEAALNHLTGWASSWNMGSYKVISPGARGASVDPQTSGDKGGAENAARDLDYELLLTGKLKVNASQLKSQGQYFLAPYLLLGLSPAQLEPIRKPGTGTALAGPNGPGPWTVDDVPYLISTLYVRRAGNQHSAWFKELDAFDPQYQAGVNANGPWYRFFDDVANMLPPNNQPLVMGGPSPFADPTQPAGPVQQYGVKKS